MSVDWSVVRRDEDGDWHTPGHSVPGDIPVYNSSAKEDDWRAMAEFCTAVANALRGEEIDRQFRDGKMRDFVAGRLDLLTDTPFTAAGIAVAAVREFEEANPVD